MRIGNTFLGYRIEDGKALINTDEAEKVKKIFDGYISGLSFVAAAKAVGLQLTHTSVKAILCNKHYIGDDFYPPIIDRVTFDAAENERLRRYELFKKKTIFSKKEPKGIPQNFYFEPNKKKFKDPYEQASYVYSLIKCKV